MSTASAAALVRVSVTSGARRVDLAVPGAVPVVELLPELARSVGLLDPRTAHGGYRLVTAAGRKLAPDVGLTGQGVEDGCLLAVVAGSDDAPVRVYDDLVEAMSDTVERDQVPWSPAAGRRTALAAAALLMTLGAVALAVQRGSPLAAGAAAVGCLTLLAGAVVLSRVLRERAAAVGVAWLASAYGATAGLLATGGDLAGAGAGSLAVGLPALVGVARPLVLPPVVVGAVGLGVGVVLRVTTADVRVVLTATLVLVVLVDSVVPWLALGVTGTTVGPPSRRLDLAASVAPVDPGRLRADARTAHEILVALTGTVGLLLVLTAPLAVRLGAAGTTLAVVACGVTMLRTRRHRAGTVVLVGLVSGMLGLAVVTVSVLAWWPDRWAATAIVLGVAGAGLLVLTLRSTPASVRRARLGDLAETAGLLALLPLLVVAAGLGPTIGG